jgi:hypothetical protein
MWNISENRDVRIERMRIYFMKGHRISVTARLVNIKC